MLLEASDFIHTPLEDGRTNPNITAQRLYVVTCMQYDDVQVVNDKGEPILVPRRLFREVDDWIPTDWIKKFDPEGELGFWGPASTSARGFFERWHDGAAHEMEVFASVYAALWHHHAPELKNQKLVLKMPARRT